MRFGDPGCFEIAARWSIDTEPRERLPKTEGWSTGELRISVGGQVLTEHRFRDANHIDLSWYLSPVIDWLIRNWICLLHEERYAWLDKSGQPAAVATFSALERTMSSQDEEEQQHYETVHAWWTRHALRAADSSALYPDIYFRRLGDDIEISWLARQPEFAPAGFSLSLAPGYALLPVNAVAEPLWQFLKWATETAPVVEMADQAMVAGLKARFTDLSKTSVTQLEQAYVGEWVQRMLEKARAALGLLTNAVPTQNLPAITSMDSAVLMFGGLNVDIGESDIEHLVGFLASQQGGAESPTLSRLVRNPEHEVWSRPHEEGYRLAEDCRDELDIAPEQVSVDLADILQKLDISVVDQDLDTNTIRGVALAGSGFAPAILINTTSSYNKNEVGRRFTLAHELCHILYDRTRARKLSHLSGPWASARTEKRANAFAAMFLAPPSAIRRKLSAITEESVRQLASEVGMGITALIEHLYNVDLINDAEREELRSSLDNLSAEPKRSLRNRSRHQTMS